MNRRERVKHEFVEFMPKELEPETIYISIEFATCQHLCLCGCGEKVVTPLTPTDWAVTFDGETISLDPSVGNWSFDCQSHYVIRRGRVRWAPSWSKEKIAVNRANDRRRKGAHYGDDGEGLTARRPTADRQSEEPGFFGRALERLGIRRRRSG